MTTSQAAAPRIRNAATKPRTPRKLFVNIPVRDLPRAIAFFEALDFAFNPQFTDATSTCMLVGEDAYFMLVTREKYKEFARRPFGDPRKESNALFSIGVNSRADVDATVEKAVAGGGTRIGNGQDLGFMYTAGFYDLDGHHWDVFWMDPNTTQG